MREKKSFGVNGNLRLKMSWEVKNYGRISGTEMYPKLVSNFVCMFSIPNGHAEFECSS